jgi:hypothetical protein
MVVNKPAITAEIALQFRHINLFRRRQHRAPRRQGAMGMASL